MDGTKGAHHSHADDASRNDYRYDDKAHGVLWVIDYALLLAPTMPDNEVL